LLVAPRHRWLRPQSPAGSTRTTFCPQMARSTAPSKTPTRRSPGHTARSPCPARHRRAASPWPAPWTNVTGPGWPRRLWWPLLALATGTREANRVASAHLAGDGPRKGKRRHPGEAPRIRWRRCRHKHRHQGRQPMRVPGRGSFPRPSLGSEPLLPGARTDAAGGCS